MINDRPNNVSLGAGANPVKPEPSVKPGMASNKEPVEPKTETPEAEAPVRADARQIEADKKEVSAAEQAAVRKEEVKQRVNEAIPKVRELMNKNQRSLDFKVAEEENRIIVTVIDKETDKVIRQIPPEDLLQIADSIDQGISPLKEGALIHSKA